MYVPDPLKVGSQYNVMCAIMGGKIAWPMCIGIDLDSILASVCEIGFTYSEASCRQHAGYINQSQL